MTVRPESKPKKNWFKLAIGLLISTVAIILVLQFAKWEELGPTLAKAGLSTYLIILILTLVFLSFRALGWRKLLGDKPSFWQAFWGINKGYLLNNALPFRAGEIARAALLARQTGLTTTHVLSTIVIERAVDVAVAAGLFLSMLGRAVQFQWAKTISIVMLILVAAGFIMLFIMARYTDLIKRWIESFSVGKPFVAAKIKPHLFGLLDGFSTLTNPAQLIVSILFFLLSWVSAVSLYTLVLRAFVPEAPLWWGVFADASLAMGIAIPSAPAALGTFEAAIVGALSLLGVDQTTGLAYAIVMHFTQIVITGVLGVIGLIFDARSKRAQVATVDSGGIQ